MTAFHARPSILLTSLVVLVSGSGLTLFPAPNYVFLPQTQHVNLRIVRQPERGSARRLVVKARGKGDHNVEHPALHPPIWAHQETSLCLRLFGLTKLVSPGSFLLRG